MAAVTAVLLSKIQHQYILYIVKVFDASVGSEPRLGVMQSRDRGTIHVGRTPAEYSSTKSYFIVKVVNNFTEVGDKTGY